jgi:hypothetical protein
MTNIQKRKTIKNIPCKFGNPEFTFLGIILFLFSMALQTANGMRHRARTPSPPTQSLIDDINPGVTQLELMKQDIHKYRHKDPDNLPSVTPQSQYSKIDLHSATTVAAINNLKQERIGGIPNLPESIATIKDRLMTIYGNMVAETADGLIASMLVHLETIMFTFQSKYPDSDLTVGRLMSILEKGRNKTLDFLVREYPDFTSSYPFTKLLTSSFGAQEQYAGVSIAQAVK